jgi:ATP diphosphatase
MNERQNAAAPSFEPGRDITRLLAIMAALRTPGTGCPWDLAQSFATIAPYTIEEAYEVADAIERGDLDDLREELGDLLLQVVYHARMAEEAGAFAFADVVETITAKLIRRHPHVFARRDAARLPPDAANAEWDAVKAAEKAARAARGSAAAEGGTLTGVPVGMAALTRAVKLQDKAAKVGFDWNDVRAVLAKIREETAEVETALAEGAGRDAVAAEIGDLLFAVANLARHARVDAEAALRGANLKFERRFRYIEARLAADGRDPAASSLAEMDALWTQSKAEGL